MKLSVVIKKIGIKILEKFAYFHSKVKKKICVLRGYSTSEINEDIFRYIRQNNNQCHGHTS